MPINVAIENLFTDAKAKDEFEFVSALMDYKGMGNKRETSSLHEWFDSIQFYETLYNAQGDLDKKARIGLLIYSTFFENSDFYTILGNLARIKLGYRSFPYLYFKDIAADRWYGTSEKIGMIDSVLEGAGHLEIQQFFEDNHFKPLRDSFFHSSYSILGNSYILLDSKPIKIDGMLHSSVSIPDFIIPKVQNVLEFFHSFRTNYLNHYNSYTENKIVTGHFPQEIQIEIIGSPEGLRGFNAAGSWIRLEDNGMWMAMNINFNFPTSEGLHIKQELIRMFNRTNVRKNDIKLSDLHSKIKSRNRPAELQALADVYRKFGAMVNTTAVAEANDFARRKFYEISLQYHQRALEVDPAYEYTHGIGMLKWNLAIDDIARQDGLKELLVSLEKKFDGTYIKPATQMIQELSAAGKNIAVEKGRLLTVLNNEPPGNEEFNAFLQERKEALNAI